MQRINIDISGEGPHDVISPSSGKRFLVNSCLMTFAHAHPKSQPVTFLSGSTVLYGPYLVFDGEKLMWQRNPDDTFDIKPGEAFRIKLAAGVRCGATIEYEIGAW